MNKACLVVACSVFATSSFLAQERIPIKGVTNTPLAKGVFEAIAIGGMKDTMSCDSSGNIFTPVNRGYSESYGSIAKIDSDGQRLTSFSLDKALHLDAGSIEAFDVTESGEVVVLALERTDDTDHTTLTAPPLAYILRYGPTGDLISEVRLRNIRSDMTPTGLAILDSQQVLIAGYKSGAEHKIKVLAQVFDSKGFYKRDVLLPGDGTQSSNTELVATMSVIRPVALNANGKVYVLRGSGREPVYTLSTAGDLVATTELDLKDIEFSSPQIVDGQLIVHRQRSPKPDAPAISYSEGSESDLFVVFDLNTGKSLKEFEWKERGELACYQKGQLLLLYRAWNDWEGDDGNHEVIIRAEPKRPETTKQLAEGPIHFQIRPLTKCGTHSQRMPLRDDDAATSFCLAPENIVDENDIASADVSTDALGRPLLHLHFTQEGARKMETATSTARAKHLGLLIDGVLVMHAEVLEPIRFETAISGGKMSVEELQNWANRLNTAAARRNQLNQT